MKTIIVTATFCLILSGCGQADRNWTSFTGDLTYKCSRKGVEYVQSDSGLAVSYDQDGNPVRCKP